MQISKLDLKSPEYPELLKEVHSPPKQLYVRGQLPEGNCVAIVGSRDCTDYGEKFTYQFASELARAGVVIVSGLAFGIDAIAHRAAIEAGGKTVAVLASGVDNITPIGNYRLGKKIIDHGALISEYPSGTEVYRGNFPARNRIIAGISKVVVVTEANAESGALITANIALTENRTVMAVPGNINQPRSAGANNLLRSGASPATSSQDILNALDIKVPSGKSVKASSKEEATILQLISRGVYSNQALIEQSAMDAAEFAQVISLMEITGKVRNLGAGNWTLG